MRHIEAHKRGNYLFSYRVVVLFPDILPTGAIAMAPVVSVLGLKIKW